MNNVRKTVVNALVNFEEQQGFSNLTLDGILNKNNFSANDKAFASRLFYGVIERKITLDYYISKLSSKPIQKLSSIVLNSIRIAIYQLEYMDKIPANAAVNESVNIIKSSKEKYAAGFVNAVLRSFLRDKPKLPNDTSNFAMSVKYSCPGWFIEEMCSYMGKDSTVAFLEDSLNPPPIFLRVNNTVTNAKKLIDNLNLNGISVKETNIENCLKAESILGIDKTEAFINGQFHIQDISSQICISALSLEKGDKLLDVCAAPGGKTCTAAEIMENQGEVYSCDLHPHRVQLIKKNADRLSLSIINPTVNDALKLNQNFNKFNKILCDVPCSGFGVIRRKPEIKYKSKSDLTSIPDLQYNILEISSQYLENGGTLVYSTCTLRQSENEDVVERFLKNHCDFYCENPYPQFFHKNGCRLYNENCGGDGFFFAVLKRK